MQQNREQRRRQGASPDFKGMLDGLPTGPKALLGALFSALMGGCQCKTCVLLRKAAATLGDDLLEGDDGQTGDPDPQRDGPDGYS